MVSNKTFGQPEQITGNTRGLPNAAFTTHEFLYLENQRLFAGSRILAGVASEIPNRGDVQPVDVGGRSLILTRDNNAKIRVFQNICPHRGTRLVDQRLDGTNALTCPYHSWTFELDGRLQGRPHYYGPGKHDRGDGGNDPVCLFEVRSHTWCDWVFVNIDGSASSFEDYMRPLIERFTRYDLSGFRFSKALSFEFGCNWKLAVENYNDVYHVFKVHPTLNEMHEPSDRYAMTVDGLHLFNGYSFAGPGRGLTIDETGPVLPELPGLPDELSTRMQWVTAFPNTAINIYPSNLQLVTFRPDGPERTQMHMWFYFVGEGASKRVYEHARQMLYAEWSNLNAEDEDVCRRMQLGRSTCDAYDGGRLAPYWDVGTRHFHTQVARLVSPT